MFRIRPSKTGRRMILFPSSKEELGAQLREADVLIDEIDLSELNQLIDHTPDDMTATVESGMKLSDFQDVIRIGGQWLPVDPPNPEALSISELISTNASGPSLAASGDAWPIDNPDVPPEKRPSVSKAQCLSNPIDFR